MIHCGKIPIYCAKSPIQCKITCCGQNCTLNVWLHHENHTLSCTFFVNYTTFVKYMDHFHVQSRKFYTWQKKFTQAPPVVPVTNMRYAEKPFVVWYSNTNISQKLLYFCKVYIAYVIIDGSKSSMYFCTSSERIVYIGLWASS